MLDGEREIVGSGTNPFPLRDMELQGVIVALLLVILAEPEKLPALVGWKQY